MNPTNSHMKGFALGVALKQRRKASRKWAIDKTFVCEEYTLHSKSCKSLVKLGRLHTPYLMVVQPSDLDSLNLTTFLHWLMRTRQPFEKPENRK